MTTSTTADVKQLVDASRGALERWLLEADERRSMSTARAIVAVRRASAALATFGDGEALDDRAIGALDAARSALEDAHRRLGDAPADASTIAEVQESLASARRAALDLLSPVARAADVTAPFRASVGRPAVHGGIEVPDPQVIARDDDRDDDDDDDAEPAAADRLGAPPAEADPAWPQIRALARDCLEDVGVMGSLRRLWDHEPWHEAAAFEQRLLDALDALVALERPLDPRGPRLGLVRETWRYATEWTVPDRGRSFALGFVLGCLDSRVANVWLSLALRTAHPAAADAYVQALSLASSPHVDVLLDELLLDDDPAVLRAALAAAARRRRAPPWAAALCGHPDLGVARAAIAAVRHLPADLAQATLEPLLVDERPALVTDAAATLVEIGVGAAAERLRDVLRNDPAGDGAARAASTLALIGLEADGDLLQDVARRSPELTPWLGWHGHPRHLPVLLDAAEAAGATHLAHLVADAIERMTGLPFDPPLVLDARAITPALDLARHRERLREHAAREPLPSGRVRRGKAFAVDAVLAELTHPGARQGARRVLARELSIASGGRAVIDVETWNAVQRDELMRLRDAPPWRSAR